MSRRSTKQRRAARRRNYRIEMAGWLDACRGLVSIYLFGKDEKWFKFTEVPVKGKR